MIRLEKLRCRLGEFTLDIDVTVNEGEYFVVLGPNGSGKTVLLETIAGFNRPESGYIFIEGRETGNTPPEKRGIGIVYQDDALFPHLSVRENVVYGLKARNAGRKETEETLEWISNFTGISGLLSRRPENLSGGEKRRVALARGCCCWMSRSARSTRRRATV